MKMHLIIGGAYQGKLEYGKERFGFDEADVFFCMPEIVKDLDREMKIDFSKKAIYGLEHFILGCVYRKMEAKDYFLKHGSEWAESILICTDVSSGIVPYELELRAFREMVGRTLMYLGKEAEDVTRMFCGIPQKIK